MKPLPILLTLGPIGIFAYLLLDNEDAVQIQRGRKAIRDVLRTKKDVKNAMFHPELGRIDFNYGTPSTCGISYISKRAGDRHAVHNDGETGGKILFKVPEIIMRGDKTPLSHESRTVLEYNGYRVVLDNIAHKKRRKMGERGNHWVFHAYDIHPSKNPKNMKKR